MAQLLAGISICMLGGDLRELELARALAQLGADLRLVGYPPVPELALARHFTDARAAAEGADVILGPMSNTDLEGKIQSRLDKLEPIDLVDVMHNLPLDTPVLLGAAKPIIHRVASECGLRVVETAEIDEIAILNSIPTAEGAIQVAMVESEITIHGSHCLVLGFGRCGITLARTLQGLGAHVLVAARSKPDLARIKEMRLTPVPMDTLLSTTNVDFIFNTVPALVITGEYLEKLLPKTLVIDLAAIPGGTDFATAEKLGIRVIHALSLPGKVAPKTAGQILINCIPQLLKELVGGEADVC